jgi:hypothetical protein
MSKPARFDFKFVGDDGRSRVRVTLNGRELDTASLPVLREQWDDEWFQRKLNQMMTDVFEAGRRTGKSEVQFGVRRELGL